MSASYHSGEINGEATPVPIPNTEVKLSRAEDTWLETARESRYSPDFFMQKILHMIEFFIMADPPDPFDVSYYGHTAVFAQCFPLDRKSVV